MIQKYNFPRKILSFCALLSCLCGYAAYDFKVDNIYYKVNSDKETVNVSSSISTMTPDMVNTDYAGDIIVPESVTYNGKSYIVTGVEDFCTFEYAKALRSVVLPQTITTLPKYAFSWCSALSKVELGNNLVAIPENCFLDCGALREITIPSSVEKIGKSAFQGCVALSNLIIPDNVTTIESSAFVGCKALSQLTISDSPITLKIGPGYYDGIYKGAFDDCPFIDIYIGRNITNKSTNHDQVFAGHKTLTNIIFGKNITQISKQLFSNCTSLKTIDIQGANLKNIQDEAFRGCSKLQDIKGLGLNNVESIGMFAFSYCPEIKEIVLPKIKSIGKSAFYSYEGHLERVLLGDNISVIPERCFDQQTSLKYAYLGSSISEIEPYAFNKCDNLSNIFLFSDNLVSVDEKALPSTIAKIYVPNPSRYSNLLNSYYLDYLAIINSLTTEYSGVIPKFSYINNVVDTNMKLDDTTFNINVGGYNAPVSVIFTLGEWTSSTKLSCSYTITPAPLTVIANDASRRYSEGNPELTCSFFGFKNGETADVLTRMPNVETTATITSSVGTYPIIPSGAEAQNYTFNYERGTLTVLKADHVINWEQKFENVNVGDVIELTASSSAGLPIKYTTTDETVADIYTQGGKKYVEFMKPGNIMIHARQEGNENYNEADRVSKSVNVGLLVSGITLNQTAITLAEGSSLHLVASVYPENASNKTLAWESANPEIATVGADGTVNAIKQGMTTIIVKSTDGSNIPASCEVQVIKLATSITLNLQTIPAEIGSEHQLIATVLPDDATNKDVTWSSSDKKVATVNSDGLVKIISTGKCMITATTVDGSNLSAKCEILTSTGINNVVNESVSNTIIARAGKIQVLNKDAETILKVFSIQGTLIAETTNAEIDNLSSGLYIVTVGSNCYKVKL